MITKEQFIDSRVEVEKIAKGYLNKSFEEYEDKILHSTDEKEREQNLRWLTSLCFSYDKYENDIKVDRAFLSAAYDDMVYVTEELSKAFECEFVSDTEFAVKTNHKHLSDFAIMLEKWFGFKSTSGFTFSSSFTTHNAKTEHSLYVDITCTDDGRGLLKFHLGQYWPYWLPRDERK